MAHLLPHYGPALDRLTTLIAKAPRARHVLDHVSATPETVLRRALLLGARFWLPGARLLCVGDHDLTSLAVKLVHPETDVTVVDVDERILAYLDEQRLGVRTRWADLRLGLPSRPGITTWPSPTRRTRRRARACSWPAPSRG
ncbi:bis-aminopropyl spermidine synthase family protein [Nonomuraea thailandensis]